LNQTDRSLVVKAEQKRRTYQRSRRAEGETDTVRITSVSNLSPALVRLRDRLRPRIGWMQRSAAATIIAGLAVLSAIVATIGWGIASAGNDTLTGRSVSDDQLAAIVSAARSCPMLTPARIAGQLMAESGLNNDAAHTQSGGQGIAGLDNTDWKQWSPWPNAQRADSSANIFALAHEMCDLSGQLRMAKVPGDQWRLALAAFRSGLPAVTKAGGIPSVATDYVDQASGYAAYYARLPQFGNPGAGPLAATGPPTNVKPVPDQYVQPIVAAGKVCQQVTPAAVAAELMAASAFSPNLLGANGAQGIAQFLPEVWLRYGPTAASVNASAWDPAVAIPTVGTALCGMITELSGLPGDPYLHALAAFRVGTNSIRQTGGTPDSTTQAFIDKVTTYTGYYSQDTRLTAPAQSTSTPLPPTPAPTQSPSVTATKPPAPANPIPPAPKPTTAGPLPGHSFVQQASHKCLDAGVATDGIHLTLRTCGSGSASQRWDIRGDGTIRSILTGLCMDVAMASTATGTLLQTANCSGNPAQQFKVSGTELVSTLANKCADSVGNNPTDGTEVNIWDCVGNPKQTWTLT
jgi:hypothetical protein